MSNQNDGKHMLQVLEESAGSSFNRNTLPIEYCEFYRKTVTARDLRKRLGVEFATSGTEDNQEDVPDNTKIRGIVLCYDKCLGGLYILVVCKALGKRKEIPMLNDRSTLKSMPEFESWRHECKNWNAHKFLFTRVRQWYDNRF